MVVTVPVRGPVTKQVYPGLVVVSCWQEIVGDPSCDPSKVHPSAENQTTVTSSLCQWLPVEGLLQTSCADSADPGYTVNHPRIPFLYSFQSVLQGMD